MTGRKKTPSARPAHRADSQSGMALLLALLIILSLTAFSASLVLFIQSGSQLSNTMASRSQAYYAALAGLEEARGRLNPGALDQIWKVAPQPPQVNQVLYLVNSTPQDPVNPTDPSSPYYDYEYTQEFTGGFGGAQVLGSLPSDQPGAGSPYVIPYKWVRITLETEYASKTDVNHDGILNSTTPIYWDGANQYLGQQLNSVPVYMLTALAVEANGIKKMEQEEVVGTLPPAAVVGTAGSASLTGLPAGSHTSPNLTLNGNDHCGVQNLPGIAAGSTITTSGLNNIQGNPPEQSTFSFLPSQTAPNIIQSLLPQAVPILNADPTHMTLAPGGASLVGTNVVLGQLPGGSNPGQPAVVYANQSLAISGPASSGYGVLLVSGNLSITDGFLYEGLIVANGTVTITASSAGNIRIHGSLTSFGNLSINSSASPSTSVWIHYNSCAVPNPVVRSFKELSF